MFFLGRGRIHDRVGVVTQGVRLFSECLGTYLLYLCLKRGDSFEWIYDDVVNGMIHGFDFDIDEELIYSFLWLTHS